MIEREPAFRLIMQKELINIRDVIRNPVIVDLGANIGDYTVFMNELFDGTPHKILAVEADIDNYNFLVHNMRVNDVDAICKNYAIADKNGMVEFFSSNRNNLGSLAFRDGVAKNKVLVPCRTLEAAIVENGLSDPSFIKMDIEGGEVLVLKGVRDYFRRVFPSILMEVHPYIYDEDKFNLEKELKYLFDNGWTCELAVTSAYDEYPEWFNTERIHTIEVKPGWRRSIIKPRNNNFILKYACHLDEYGIPDWHGGVSKKLIRAIYLRKN